jgi:hypothetical protein
MYIFAIVIGVNNRMTMKTLRFALLSMISPLFFTNTPACAADSTGVAPASSIKPGQMFILDSGTVDFYPQTGGTSFYGYVCGPGNNAPQCIGHTHGRGICPSGFVPYVSVTLTKTLSTSSNYWGGAAGNTGMTGICASNFWVEVVPKLDYSFGFSNSAAYSSTAAGTSAPSAPGSSVAFRWDIYCYPGNFATTSGPNIWNYNSGAACDASPIGCTGQAPQGGSGACSQTYGPNAPQFAYDLQPYVLGQGVVGNHQKSTTNTSYFFWPPGQCPAGWSTYANIWPQIEYAPNTLHGPTLKVIGTCNASAGMPRTVVKYVNYTIEDGGTPQYGGVASVGYMIMCYPNGYTVPFYQGPVIPPASRWINSSNGLVDTPPC